MTELQDSFLKGFKDVSGEYSLTPLETIGEIPSWLSGNLIFNGPAKYHIGQQEIIHWFLGLAMLKSFKIHNNRVVYSNKFLNSEFYASCIKNQGSHDINAGFYPQSTMHKLENILFGSGKYHDNCLINITTINHKHVALTETTSYVIFDPETLDTIGPLLFQDRIGGQTTTAHPQMDFKRGIQYNLVINYGRQPYYTFYKLKTGMERRDIVVKIPVQKPAYLHSFAMSENYLILIEPPVRTSAINMRFAPELYFEKFHWDGRNGTKITIVHKDTGQVVKIVETEPFFMFHQISAYEVKDQLIIDLPTYKDSSALQQTRLEKNQILGLHTAHLTRITIPMKNGKPIMTIMSDKGFEFPQINYKKHNAKPYRYVYGSGDHQGQVLYSLVKFDMSNGNIKSWHDDHCFMGEPLFIEKPEAKSEDDGVLLAIGLDAKKDKSFLVVIDTLSMEERARAYTPHVIPYSFHGQFYRS
jgi:beta,beta-carotene 9',10'-dioxygenase